jgi:hypothetical protein
LPSDQRIEARAPSMAVIHARTVVLLLSVVRRFIDWLGTHLSMRTLADRMAEGLREIALLWFVFANLDIIVQTDRFSWAWSIKNTVGTVIVWSFAVVFEAAIEKKGAHQ